MTSRFSYWIFFKSFFFSFSDKVPVNGEYFERLLDRATMSFVSHIGIFSIFDLILLLYSCLGSRNQVIKCQFFFCRGLFEIEIFDLKTSFRFLIEQKRQKLQFCRYFVTFRLITFLGYSLEFFGRFSIRNLFGLPKIDRFVDTFSCMFKKTFLQPFDQTCRSATAQLVLRSHQRLQ